MRRHVFKKCNSTNDVILIIVIFTVLNIMNLILTMNHMGLSVRITLLLLFTVCLGQLLHTKLNEV